MSQTVLLGLRYQDLSWDSARPVQENNPDCLSCLFLQFQVLEGGQRVFKVLQVFSKQVRSHFQFYVVPTKADEVQCSISI